MPKTNKGRIENTTMAYQLCKRNAETISALEESSSSSSSAALSRRRRRTTSSFGGCELQLSSSQIDFRDSHLFEFPLEMLTAGSPVDYVDSDEVSSDGCSVSCCSCNKQANQAVVDERSSLFDLEAGGFKSTDSTYANIKFFSKLSEFSGDSEEMELREKPPPALESNRRSSSTVKMPPKDEIEEFFSVAEKYEQKRFAEKYNYDIVKDVPLEGRYQWVRFENAERSSKSSREGSH